jgi:gamma-glutamyltranspeptidase / glutathione hydrolase
MPAKGGIMPSSRRVLAAALLSTALIASVSTATTAAASRAASHQSRIPDSYETPPKQAVAVGSGGAVSSVDADATAVGIRVLQQGGTAADAAVATAAALGVTEPYSAGVGGGGYLVYYNASTGKVTTLDGRETAPLSMRHDAFIDPSTGQPYNFTPELVTSGVSVGVPGTPALWALATRRWGHRTFGQNMRPAADLARRGFVVDPTFNLQTRENAVRFAAITTTRALYLPGGDAPAVGSTFRNPDLGDTYDLLARKGIGVLYHGWLGAEIVRTVQHPPKVEDTELPVMPGTMTRADLGRYSAIVRRPTHIHYRGYTIDGMAPSSSGGTTVSEALNILENFDLGFMPRVEALNVYLEASARAYADRNAYIGDPAYVDVPEHELLSQGFANERACTIDPLQASPKPVAPGEPDGSYQGCSLATNDVSRPDTEGQSTSHLVAADRWGDVASYTLTIEQTGGSGIVVPHRGFLLNNELTDFTAVYNPADPNRIEGGKRPRSSMSPTIVLRHGRPFLAIGSPGGATIITTVLQTLVNYLDFGMRLPDAIEAPRASQRNAPTTTAEQAFIDQYGAALGTYGQTFAVPGLPGTSAAQIGAVTAIRLLRGDRFLAAAEQTRRGGGAAAVVQPAG